MDGSVEKNREVKNQLLVEDLFNIYQDEKAQGGTDWKRSSVSLKWDSKTFKTVVVKAKEQFIWH